MSGEDTERGITLGRRKYDEDLCNERHGNLERRIVNVEQILEEVRNRPSWLILIIVSALATGCGSMIMFIITGHPK